MMDFAGRLPGTKDTRYSLETDVDEELVSRAILTSAAPQRRVRELRGRRMRLAVATSLVAKTASIGLQFAAVPIAVQLIGPTGFGLFITVSALVSWVALTSVGIGPGLTRGVARAVADADIEGERAYFWMSAILMSAISLLIAALITAAFIGLPAGSLTGATDPALGGEERASLVAVGLLAACQLLLSIVDAARLGYQESFISNLWTVAATTVSFLVLLALGRAFPTVVFLVVALNAPPVVARALNGAFLLRGHPNLRPPRLTPDLTLASQLVLVGIGFAAISLGSFLSQQIGLVLVAQHDGPEAVAGLGATLRLIMLASSAVAMLTLPLWPALTDATERADMAWARSAYLRVLALSLAYSGLVSVALLLFGEHFVHIWTGGALRVDQTMIVLFALYFPLGVWSHVHAMTLVGLGRIGLTGAVLVAEGFVAVAITLATMPAFGATAVALALLASTAVVSAWVLPLITHRTFARLAAVAPSPRVAER